MSIKLGAWYTSSADPEKLGKSITGLLVGLSTVILILAKHYNLPLTEGDYFNAAQQVGAAISALLVAYGLVQKLFLFAANLFHKNA